MEVGWISARGLRSPAFRVVVWWDDAQVVVVVAFSPIKSPRLQPHFEGDVEKVVEVLCF
jgi:hypothetical protein